MLSNFFIKRPIFAIVTSLIIVIVGLLAMFKLPIEQYPNMSPVQITVSASYPGADAQTIAETVAAPIETQVNGVDNMIYMTSSSSSQGIMSLTVFFEMGTDPDIAQVQVQNRVNLATPMLPDVVKQNGVTIEKRSSSILMLIGVYGEDERYTRDYVQNYANVYVLEAIKRVPGAGQAAVMGSADQAMRIWLNPDKMASLGITTNDVSSAVKIQNQRYAGGNLGAAPSVPGTVQTFPILAPEPAVSADGYENIVLKTDSAQSALVRVKDVASVEMGRRSYDVIAMMNSRPTTFIAVYQQPGANALTVAGDVKKTLEQMKSSFPEGMDYRVAVDSTTFVKISIEEVIKTLFEAALLVIGVIYIFLQNFRSTAIACSAIIVALTGTFAGMYLCDFSINQLTLFGMVLAIGLVVDDAIVVVENVERNMSDFAMNPEDATIHAMSEVTGPVIATVLVLASVFVPAGFMGGTTGMLYKQFAITIAISVTISGFVALSLTPALCAKYLRHRPAPTKGFFHWFNKMFTSITVHYGKWTRWLFRKTFLVIICFIAMIAVIIELFRITPTGFVPEEDQGYLVAAVMMPKGGSLQRTDEVVQTLAKSFEKIPAVETVNAIAGFSLLDGGVKADAGTMFLTLTPFDERYKNSETAKKDSASAIMKELQVRGMTSQMTGLLVPINPPAIPGLGTTGGFEFWIQDTDGSSPQQLQSVLNKFVEEAKKRPELTGITTTFSASNQQMRIHYDRDKAQLLGLNSADVFGTLQAQFGSAIVSQFSQFSRVWYVVIQADPNYRVQPNDIGKLFVRNSSGDMIPLNSVITTEYVEGPTILPHYNGFPSAQVIGNAAPGYSSGQGMKALEEVAAQVLPQGFSYGWTGISYEQKQSGSSSAIIIAFGLLLVFLVLAAQYESWSLPGSVMMAVPFGVIGAFIATWMRGLENDVFFQIGLLVMIGLAAKNAILIVEFAVELRDKGLDMVTAAIDAGEIRFRPIIMTSLAFIGGMIPMMLATGAGAASRHSLGTGVVGGMIGVSSLALLFVPIFYIWFENGSERRKAKDAAKTIRELVARGIPIPDKLRLQAVRGNLGVYDVNAKVSVGADGQIIVTNSPGFDPSKVTSRDYGVPGGDDTPQTPAPKETKEQKAEPAKEAKSAQPTEAPKASDGEQK